MTLFLKAIASLSCLTLMAGCDQMSAPTSKPPAEKAAEDPLKADVERMEAGIRIAAANKRIDELERQVGALQATPEKLDLSLLTDRVAALEAKAGGMHHRWERRRDKHHQASARARDRGRYWTRLDRLSGKPRI